MPSRRQRKESWTPPDLSGADDFGFDTPDPSTDHGVPAEDTERWDAELRAEMASKFPDNPDRAEAAFWKLKYELAAGALDALPREDCIEHERGKWEQFKAMVNARSKGAFDRGAKAYTNPDPEPDTKSELVRHSQTTILRYAKEHVATHRPKGGKWTRNLVATKVHAQLEGMRGYYSLSSIWRTVDEHWEEILAAALPADATSKKG